MTAPGPPVMKAFVIFHLLWTAFSLNSLLTWLLATHQAHTDSSPVVKTTWVCICRKSDQHTNIYRRHHALCIRKVLHVIKVNFTRNNAKCWVSISPTVQSQWVSFFSCDMCLLLTAFIAFYDDFCFESRLLDYAYEIRWWCEWNIWNATTVNLIITKPDKLSVYCDEMADRRQ